MKAQDGGEIANATLVRDYVCGRCHSNLVVRWRENEGSYVECRDCGRRVDFVKKTTIHYYNVTRQPGRYQMQRNPVFARFMPDDMRRDNPRSGNAMEDLFES